MTDESSEQNKTSNQTGETNECGPGCNCDCGTTGKVSTWKTIICLVVVIAAGIVLAKGFARKAENKASQVKESYAVTAPADKVTKTAGDNQTSSSVWKPLKDIATLNEVASDKDAVLVYLTKKGQKPDDTIKQYIEQAATKSQSGGNVVSLYLLDNSSPDYAQITSQSLAPCVLVMVKGGGMSTVSGDITEEKLLQAVVAGSRPSG